MVTEQITKERKESKNTKWVKLSSRQIESLIIDLAKTGLSASQIGLELRDKHGVPKTKSQINKRISEVLESEDIKTKKETRPHSIKITNEKTLGA
jgi:hypothetical protein